MTKLDIEMKKREHQKANIKLDAIAEILDNLKNRQDYMKEADGSIAEYWELEYSAIEELKEAVSNLASKL